MLQDLAVEAVGISVKAQVSDFAVTLGRLKLANGAVNFDIDNSHLHQTGTVSLADARFAIDWQEDFRTTQPITTRINAKGVMTDVARQTLNIGLQNILTGPVPVTADMQGHRGQLTTADVTLDLTNSALAIPILHLGKQAGQAAAGHVTVNFASGDMIRDEAIRITGPNVAANGIVSFDRSGSLSVLNFASVKMGALNDLSFVLTRSAARRRLCAARTLDGWLPDRAQCGRDRRSVRQSAAAGRYAHRTVSYRCQAGPAGDARWRGDRALQSRSRRCGQQARRP